MLISTLTTFNPRSIEPKTDIALRTQTEIMLETSPKIELHLHLDLQKATEAIRKGFRVSSDKSRVEEYPLLHEKRVFSSADIKKLIHNGIDAVWCDDIVREKLRTRF